MQKSSMWKLGALAGVVALGFFAVWQTQRGLQDDNPLQDGAATATADPNPTTSPPADPLGRVRVAQREPKSAPLNNPFAEGSQDEPTLAKPATSRASFERNRSGAVGFQGDTGLGGFPGDGGPGFRGTSPKPASNSGTKSTPAAKTADPFAGDDIKDGFRLKTAKSTPKTATPFSVGERKAASAPSAKSDPPKTVFGEPIGNKPPATKNADDSPQDVFGAKIEPPAAGGAPPARTAAAKTTPADDPFNLSPKKETPTAPPKPAPAPKSDASGGTTTSDPFGTLPDDGKKPAAGNADDGPSFSGNPVPPAKKAEDAGTGGKPAPKDDPFRIDGPAKPAAKPDAGAPKRTAATPTPADDPFAPPGAKPKLPPAPKPEHDPFAPSATPAAKTVKQDGDEPPKSLYAPTPKKVVVGEPKRIEPAKVTPFPAVDKNEQPKVAATKPKEKTPASTTGGEPRLMPVPPTAHVPATSASNTPAPKTKDTQTPIVTAPVKSADSPVSGPQVSIHKTAPRNAVLGKPFVYDILIKNVGTGTAHGVVVQDPIPSGVRLEGSDPQAYLSRNSLVWKLGSLAAGESKRISVKVTPVRAGQIGSVATVNFVAQTAAKPAAAAPKLVFQMQGPQTAALGEKVAFRFSVTNVGGGDAKDVWLRDIIPDGLKHPAGDDLEYKIGTIAAGKSEKISLEMTVAKAGRLTNRAFITAAGGVRIEAKAAVSVAAAKLVISRTGPSQRVIGRPAVYQNMVSNGSTETVPNGTLVESVPAGMEFVSASDGGTFDAARRTVTWSLGPLAPGKSRTVQLQLLPKQAGTQNSVVRAIGTDGSAVQTASATKVLGYVALGVDVPALDRPVNIGEQVTLRVIGRNRGTAASSNVKLQVTLPAQLSLVSVRGPGKYTVSGKTITFESLASLAGKGRTTWDLAVKAVAQGDSRVKVQIQSDEMSKPLHREEAVLVLPAGP